ncbi:MAG: DMT family transporter, partial [Woeseia sp.]
LQQGWLSPHAEQRTFWNLLAGSLVTAVTALLVESPADLATAVTRDAVIVIYLAVFSSAVTFWLSQRAAAVLSPGTVTAYSYTAPFVAMLLLFISEPQTIGWRWLPGTVLVITAIALLIRKAEPKDQAGNPRTLKHLKQETVQ